MHANKTSSTALKIPLDIATLPSDSPCPSSGWYSSGKFGVPVKFVKFIFQHARVLVCVPTDILITFCLTISLNLFQESID